MPSAQVQITQLPAAGAITGTESVPIVQNGQTVQTTTGAIAASPSQIYQYLTLIQTPQLPNSRYLSTTTGLGLTDGGAQSFYRLSLNGAAGSLEAAGGGIIVKTSSTTVTARQLATSGAGLSVSNADGTGANPTFQLTGIAAAMANLSGTGMLALTAGGTSVSGRIITGTANQINVANGNGASADPTISIVSNAIFPGTGAITVPVGSTAQKPAGSSGQIRYNSDSQVFEGYANGAWNSFSLAGGVSTFSAGSTGLTPSAASSGAVTLGGVLNVANGGTGANTLTGYVKGTGTTAMTASATIPNTDVSGLGTMSTQNASAVAITGGTIAGATITGGSINNTPIGASTAAAGTFTSVAMTTGTITTSPVNNTDVVNKQYVDNAVSVGLTVHQPVQAASVSAFNEAALVYNNGASGVGATLTRVSSFITFVIDGYSPSVGQRVMIKNQTTQAWNGVYTVTTVGSPSVGFVLTRATDADTYGSGQNQLSLNSYFFVQNGTVNQNSAFVLSAPTGVITFGTSNIQFAEFSTAILYSAGTGLTLSGTSFSITNTAVTAATYGSASQVPVLAVNAQGQLTSVTNTAIAIAAGAVSGLAPSATTDTTNAANITSGTLPTGRLSGSYTGITGVGTLTAGTWNATAIGTAYGGTGLTATPTNGQLAIGNGTGYTLANLTAGTNVSISNTAGGITISATPAAGGTVTSVAMTVPSFLSVTGSPITTSGTLAVSLSGTALPVANGGSGATTLSGYLYGNGTSAFTASTTIPSSAITGLGTMSTQNANTVAITGGNIDGTPIGVTTISTGNFSTVTATTGIFGGTF